MRRISSCTRFLVAGLGGCLLAACATPAPASADSSAPTATPTPAATSTGASTSPSITSPSITSPSPSGAAPSPSAPSSSAAVPGPASASAAPLEQRVDSLLGQLTTNEKATLLQGIWAPQDVHSVGYVQGVPRLGIPPLLLTDGPAGVRDGQPATAMPAPVALAAAFDPDLATGYGSVLGREAKARGYHVLYAPMVNIVRVPQGGRNFETLGEDPFLAGRLAAAEVRGIQAQGVAAQVKHYAANNQEDNRQSYSSEVDERTLQEIELPAFRAAVQDGRAWSAMCGYNPVDGIWACEHFPLLRDVLKGRWGFDGAVGSDYPATHSAVNAAAAGLDQEFGGSTYFSELAGAVADGRLAPAVLDDQVRRVLRLMVRSGALDGGGTAEADPGAGARAARAAAVAGTVLLKNERAALPLDAARLKSIAVIGPWADRAYTGGYGSSHVTPYPEYTVSPLGGITARAGSGVSVRHHTGADAEAAAAVAAAADVAVVVVGDEEREGEDRPSLDLAPADDALIRAVARANPRTVVVLDTGGPVVMPWLDSVPAVLEAWYPGEQSGTALADVLFGDADPGGRLPVTFPVSAAATPIRGADQYPGTDGAYHYTERLEVGYRWYDRAGVAPLFPFGHGLSYTSFDYSGLTVTGPDAAGLVQVGFDVANRGSRTGTEVPQLYVGFPSAAGEPPQQLKAFGKLTLAPGRSQHVTLRLDRSSFATWDAQVHGWQVPGGRYGITVGSSSRTPRLGGAVEVAGSAAVSTWSGRITGSDGSCLDAGAAAANADEAVRTSGCEGTAVQEATVGSDGSIGMAGGCLQPVGTADGADVRLLPCTGAAAQGWTVRPDTTILHRASGRCLQPSVGRLRLRDCGSAAEQRWHTPRPSGPVTGLAGKCVDVNRAATVDGTAVQLYHCNSTGAQDWTVQQDDTLRAFGKCLDVTNGWTDGGTPVQLYACNGTGAQRWQPRADGTLVNPVSGRCLDVQYGSTADFSRLIIWDCHAGANQRWTLPA
ncbi:glycoside hydrolase family 3 C-terminal domain-containing protein [Kitasatospora sp. A2-31]|uniref:glycoside hydrolase family 3 C-terminal domain-containing protein n=1 Tax=Kitasatospora sp. A2-31 TaxID=2916414 RepID=UPI001EED5472|nr:glycoside hydrolase family 3 C-terminal domain-containing protein [Kitasatospora sp. A2-31]MCG6499572.1 glycoside hydrolase family 3 C-terminal domain-containing protein [Kitasatospora sp. A2-31]